MENNNAPSTSKKPNKTGFVVHSDKSGRVKLWCREDEEEITAHLEHATLGDSFAIDVSDEGTPPSLNRISPLFETRLREGVVQVVCIRLYSTNSYALGQSTTGPLQ